MNEHPVSYYHEMVMKEKRKTRTERWVNIPARPTRNQAKASITESAQRKCPERQKEAEGKQPINKNHLSPGVTAGHVGKNSGASSIPAERVTSYDLLHWLLQGRNLTDTPTDALEPKGNF